MEYSRVGFLKDTINIMNMRLEKTISENASIGKVQNMNIRRNSWLLFVCLLLYCFFPVSGHATDAETRLRNITVVSDDNYPPISFEILMGLFRAFSSMSGSYGKKRPA